MPELPEVRTVVSTLNKVIKNQTVHSVDVFLNKLIKNESESMFKKKLSGRKILNVENRGKFIVFIFDNDLVMVNHLRMEGKWRFSDQKELSKNDHVVFSLDKGYLIYSDTRQFGTFHLFNKNEYLEVDPLVKLGKEPQDINIDVLFDKLKKKTIPIKSTLLDQSLLVGLGNIYVNEVLWYENIHPETPTNKITKSQLKGLIDRSEEVLSTATKMGGTTIHSFKSFNETEGSYQNELKVHMKEGQKCFKCKTPIQKIRVGGRGTYFCPKCQK